MVQLPAYLWAITIAGVTGILAEACALLFTSAKRSGVGHRPAILLAGTAALALGGWFAASAVIASHGWYHTKLGQIPWMPIAVAGFVATLVLFGRLPVVTRARKAPGRASRLIVPHTFRVVEGVVFLIAMALGGLPALFALPAGLGDIAAGIAAPVVARRLAGGDDRRALLWFTVFGLGDLTVALTIGGLTAFGLIHVSPSGAAITELPLVLIPTVGVPVLIALHIASLAGLARAPRPTRLDLPAMNYSA